MGGNRTEAWSERMERKASGSRGELGGDKSHTTEWWGKVSEWASKGLEGSGSKQQPDNKSVKQVLGKRAENVSEVKSKQSE